MYNCYQQTPSDLSIKKQLSMYHISTEIKASNAHYLLEEVEYGHLNIRVGRENRCFTQALHDVTGLQLPKTSLQVVQNDEFRLYWISPDEFLLLVAVGREFEIEKKIRANIKNTDSANHYAILNVSSAQAFLKLSGSRAQSIIKKSTAYDIHPSNLPVGKAVTTTFAKTQVILCRTKEKDLNTTSNSEEYSIIVRRSFSDYVWRWIVDAGKRE
ncbi:MAG: sarcosine oxidase subunit gamma family protein [Enterobacterales bacterium]|nr:sarcosine oxidase subunit gamma family protein [Enterobacterales bacterium]